MTSQVATLTVQTYQVSGLLTLSHYVGPAHNGYGSRVVTFKATDGAGIVRATWNQTLNFTPGADGYGVASFTLDNVPSGTVRVSAKTAWHLRKRLPVTFAGRFATANFTGASALLGGDLNDSNQADLADYQQLAAAWYQHNPASDIDGSGLVDILDYFILASHWMELGDSE